MTIRFATPADAPAILAIYAPYITDTTITFEYDVPSTDAFTERIRSIQQQLPYLVAEVDGRVLGYAYASKHRDRTAYQWSVETSVYVHPDGHRKGIARQLYTNLFAYLRQQGYYNAYAGITLPNPKSEAFHQSMGFEPVGVYRNIGYKMGAWHSVAWFQLLLQPHQLNPPAPTSIRLIGPPR
ncbi:MULTISPECIES: arsinothricin resistance N-acetyltransferase ArsN1 family B [unclassified Spirosoma]|uniref:arsinothricin resistance N-acetyltransferase ArsN1 family B n=1 Tax=unclassified Spirosoma TaxID=2621999 RepID=UPI0009651EBD|nr:MULTISPECIES: arsinothricin resistance N-acetyltransferase ArsN1 family B [unclassified Spirosoma]MBN8823427.1 N-acetyltransferase [Spirosoma sp.]OJW71957.1 MAG: N-acetyltransferase [Spirosoma sp. 48-14]